MKLCISFSAQHLSIATGSPVVKEYIEDRPYYEGDYEVEPSAHEDIVLPTRNLAMRDDVTVNKIYYAEVSNLSDGLTAFIAEHE